MSRFWYSLHQGTQGKTQTKEFADIPNFNRLNLELKATTKLLLTLNVPDSWSNKPGDFNSFALVVNDQVIADGVYQSAIVDQRVPINVSTVKELSAGNHSIAAQWKTNDGGELSIGGAGTAILTAQEIV
jgi:hypothetical protein